MNLNKTKEKAEAKTKKKIGELKQNQCKHKVVLCDFKLR